MEFGNPLSLWIINFWIALFVDYCQGLKDLRVSVPMAIRKGETAVLLCDFDLEGDSLYSVKWYKGRREFYRFTPKDEFPIKTFPIEKIPIEKLIDKSKSNMTQLILVNVDPSLSGVYNCEVSAESPSFHTELKSGEMNVVDVPHQNPRISGLKQRYSIGEILEGVCISGASRPAANLTWFINNEKVSKDHVFTSTKAKDGKDLIIARSLLKIIVKTHSFVNGMLKLRCQATIHYVYDQSVEQDIFEERSITDQETTQVVILPNNFLEKTLDKTGKKNFEDFDGSMGRKVQQFETLQILVSLLLIHDLFR